MPNLRTEWGRSRFSLTGLQQERRLSKIEEKIGHPELWNEPGSAQAMLREAEQARVRHRVGGQARGKLDDSGALFELYQEGEDVAREIARTLDQFDREVRDEELRILLGRDVDRRNAVVSIHPGAGGTESQDWPPCCCASTCATASRKLKTEMVEASPATRQASRASRSPSRGVRLRPDVRRDRRAPAGGISPFDAAKRRHTSFASSSCTRSGRDRDRESDRRTCASTPTARAARRPAHQRHRLGGAHHPPPDAASSRSARTSARSSATGRAPCAS